MAERKITEAEQAFDNVVNALDGRLPKIETPHFEVDYHGSYNFTRWVSQHFISPEGMLVTAKKMHKRMYQDRAWYAGRLNNYPKDALLIVPAAESILYTITQKDLSPRTEQQIPADTCSTILALTRAGEKSDLIHFPFIRSQIYVEHNPHPLPNVTPHYEDTAMNLSDGIQKWVAGSESIDVHSSYFRFKLIGEGDTQSLKGMQREIDEWIEIPALLRAAGHLGK